MRLSIMQPAYLPWIGYFQRMSLSDTHVILDHVQLNKSSKTKFSNRNRIRTADGSTWLTVPLKTKDRFGTLEINRLEIDETQGWASKHQKSIVHAYSRAKHYAEFSGPILQVYDRPWNRFVDLTAASTEPLLQAFGLKTPISRSSEMQLERTGSELILEICRRLKADEYISGPFGRDYLDRETFAKAGIKLLFHEHEPIPYPQAYPGFEPFLSSLDLLFNMGKDSEEILQQGFQLLEQ